MLSIIGFVIGGFTLFTTMITIPNLLDEKRKGMFALDAKYEKRILVRNENNYIEGSYYNDIKDNEEAFAVASISGKYYIQPTFNKDQNRHWSAILKPDNKYTKLDFIICLAKENSINEMRIWKEKAVKNNFDIERNELPEKVRQNSFFEFTIKDKKY